MDAFNDLWLNEAISAIEATKKIFPCADFESVSPDIAELCVYCGWSDEAHMHFKAHGWV